MSQTDTPATVVAFEADPARLARAVERALVAEETSASLLRGGAAQVLAEEATDAAVAQRFQRLLELGYLVASCDGFADEERNSLAGVLAAVTGSTIDPQTLDLHFRDLADGVDTHGWRPRLARAAADVRHAPGLDELVRLVAIIAMSDGTLSRREHDALVVLGSHVDLSATRVSELVTEAADRVKKELR